jgi:hypothetical protein
MIVEGVDSSRTIGVELVVIVIEGGVKRVGT